MRECDEGQRSEVKGVWCVIGAGRRVQGAKRREAVRRLRLYGRRNFDRAEGKSELCIIGVESEVGSLKRKAEDSFYTLALPAKRF